MGRRACPEAAGRRVKKVAGGTTTTYYYGVDGQVLWEAVNGAGSKEYLYLDGERLAAVQASNAHTMYHFKDHLGTLRVFSERDGSIYWRHDFYPGVYPERSRRGEEYTTPSDPETHKFTGQERDSEAASTTSSPATTPPPSAASSNPTNSRAVLPNYSARMTPCRPARCPTLMQRTRSRSTSPPTHTIIRCASSTPLAISLTAVTRPSLTASTGSATGYSSLLLDGGKAVPSALLRLVTVRAAAAPQERAPRNVTT